MFEQRKELVGNGYFLTIEQHRLRLHFNSTFILKLGKLTYETSLKCSTGSTFPHPSHVYFKHMQPVADLARSMGA